MTGLGVYYRGWDGSEWDLIHGPLRIAKQSLEMLTMFDSEAFVTESAYVDGQRFEGFRALPRDFDIQLLTAQVLPESQWAALDAKLKAVMRPDKMGQFVVADVFGAVRMLNARMTKEMFGAVGDPAQARRTNLVYSFTADDPWWYGPAQEHEFQEKDPPIPFFGPTGFGPPFYIAPPTKPKSTVVLNPGQVPTWGVWTFHGPTPGFSVTVDGRVISGYFAIAEGDFVTVDTRPYQKSALLSDGTNVTAALTTRQYAEIPAGESADVKVDLFGSALTVLRLEPKYFRGFS